MNNDFELSWTFTEIRELVDSEEYKKWRKNNGWENSQSTLPLLNYLDSLRLSDRKSEKESFPGSKKYGVSDANDLVLREKKSILTRPVRYLFEINKIDILRNEFDPMKFTLVLTKTFTGKELGEFFTKHSISGGEKLEIIIEENEVGA